MTVSQPRRESTVIRGVYDREPVKEEKYGYQRASQGGKARLSEVCMTVSQPRKESMVIRGVYDSEPAKEGKYGY